MTETNHVVIKTNHNTIKNNHDMINHQTKHYTFKEFDDKIAVIHRTLINEIKHQFRLELLLDKELKLHFNDIVVLIGSKLNLTDYPNSHDEE